MTGKKTPADYPAPVGELTDGGFKVYLYGSHTEAIEAQKSLGGEVERRNLWCVVVKVG